MASLKTIQDYYEDIIKLYPEVSMSDLKRILNYGFKRLLLYNSCGGDVLIKRNKFWFYSGSLMNNSLKWYHYYINKMIIKIRNLYKNRNTEWDGYYYFALTQSQYNDYLNQQCKKGRPKKNFTFNKVKLYKLYDECSLAQHNCEYIFRIPYPIEKKFTEFKPVLVTNKAELIEKRNPLNFNDILLSNYNYQFLNK